MGVGSVTLCARGYARQSRYSLWPGRGGVVGRGSGRAVPCEAKPHLPYEASPHHPQLPRVALPSENVAVGSEGAGFAEQSAGFASAKPAFARCRLRRCYPLLPLPASPPIAGCSPCAGLAAATPQLAPECAPTFKSVAKPSPTRLLHTIINL